MFVFCCRGGCMLLKGRTNQAAQQRAVPPIHRVRLLSLMTSALYSIRRRQFFEMNAATASMFAASRTHSAWAEAFPSIW